MSFDYRNLKQKIQYHLCKIKLHKQEQPKEFKVFNMEAHGIKLSFQYSNEYEFKQICEYMKETATLFGSVGIIKGEGE